MQWVSLCLTPVILWRVCMEYIMNRTLILIEYCQLKYQIPLLSVVKSMRSQMMILFNTFPVFMLFPYIYEYSLYV